MSSVDVIILSWDRLQDTIEAIQSSLNQRDVNLKVIVVDQGSKPENISQLRAFCATDDRILLLCNVMNNGVPGGRNQASFAGTGTYIVSLDNDAVFDSEYELAKTVQIMDAQPNMGILAFRIKCHGEDMDDKSSWPYSATPIPKSTTTFKTTRYVGAGHAIRRDAFEKVQGYDNSLFFMHEEVDLSKRFINAGYEIEYNPAVAVQHKVSAEHRVSWSGKRFYFDVRNRTYLHFKHKTFFPTLVFHTFLLMVKGFKLGYGLPSVKGLFAGLYLLPMAIRYRFQDQYVHETEQGKAYTLTYDPPVHTSLWGKIKYRLQHITE